jgi:hypothetical protein
VIGSRVHQCKRSAAANEYLRPQRRPAAARVIRISRLTTAGNKCAIRGKRAAKTVTIDDITPATASAKAAISSDAAGCACGVPRSATAAKTASAAAAARSSATKVAAIGAGAIIFSTTAATESPAVPAGIGICTGESEISTPTAARRRGTRRATAERTPHAPFTAATSTAAE